MLWLAYTQVICYSYTLYYHSKFQTKKEYNAIVAQYEVDASCPKKKKTKSRCLAVLAPIKNIKKKNAIYSCRIESIYEWIQWCLLCM